MRPFSRHFVVGFVVVAALLSLVPSVEHAQTTPGFAIMGDSGSDEYRADDNRGGSYSASTLNWVEQLVRQRGLNVGAWGTRSEPRRTGYEFNWARSSARTADVISQGQAAGVAGQVAAGRVSHALLIIGVNDFAQWNNTFQEIYYGSLSGAALNAKLDTMIANMRQAITTVKAAGPVTVYVATLIDRRQQFEKTFPDPVGLQRVTNAILAINQKVVALAAETGAVVFDYYSFFNLAMMPRLDGTGAVVVGGERMVASPPGDEPHHLVLGDNEHLGTVGSGLFANYVGETLNAHGLNLTPFTDAEILETARILPDSSAPSVSITAPGGATTVSGSVTVAAAALDNIGIVGVQFKVDGANLGTEDTSSPYSRSWTTGMPQNGVHTLTAVARDAAGNTTTSVPVTVTVSNVDTTLPTVSLTAPSSGATIVGTLTVSASASDNVGVAGVTFLRNGVALGAEDTQSPYSISVPTDYTQNGSSTLTAVARDAAGNSRTSTARTITINNPVPDPLPPTVSITAPAADATVAGVVTVSATASDNVGVVGVRFALDGVNLGSEDTSAPYSVSWNTVSAANGPHTLTATARDAAGRSTTASVAVAVLNTSRALHRGQLRGDAGHLPVGQPREPPGGRHRLPEPGQLDLRNHPLHESGNVVPEHAGIATSSRLHGGRTGQRIEHHAPHLRLQRLLRDVDAVDQPDHRYHRRLAGRLDHVERQRLSRRHRQCPPGDPGQPDPRELQPAARRHDADRAQVARYPFREATSHRLRGFRLHASLRSFRR